MLETGATVIDVSGAFRLRNASDYSRYYGFEHTRPDLLKTACYGLTEFAREELPGAKLIANPGCYPTSVLIPVKPLLDAGLVSAGRPIIADSKSGVTGAGKTPSLGTHFAEVSENFSAYNVLRHRHSPEIAQGLSLPAVSSSLIFTPHLLPINRGILSTIYLRVNDGVGRRDILSVWKERFRSAAFCQRSSTGRNFRRSSSQRIRHIAISELSLTSRRVKQLSSPLSTICSRVRRVKPYRMQTWHWVSAKARVCCRNEPGRYQTRRQRAG